MATEFYKLIDENANELILDQNFLTMKIGKTSRRLSVSEYAGRSGGIVRGFGLYKPKTITFGRKDKLTASGQSSFNTTRLAFQKWATKSRTTTVYFQVTVSDTATNYKAECVPLGNGSRQLFKALCNYRLEDNDNCNSWGRIAKDVRQTARHILIQQQMQQNHSRQQMPALLKCSRSSSSRRQITRHIWT
jgi:hypothetical protein